MLRFIVVPLDIDPEETESLEKAIDIFNHCQKSFSIVMHDQVHFSDDQAIAWPEVCEFLHNTNKTSRVIGVTSRPFCDQWFSHTEGKITAISIADWRALFSPPGLHCYLLLEFTLASYYHASDISENETEAHEVAKGCLHDLCGHKSDIVWKMRVGYVCSSHCEHFRTHGGDDTHLQSVQRLLDRVREVTLGRSHRTQSKESSATEFTFDSMKRHPIVVAAAILVVGMTLSWGAIWKVHVIPKNDRIAYLEKAVDKQSSSPSKSAEPGADSRLPTGKVGLSGQIAEHSTLDSKILPKLTLEIIPQISTESYEDKLNALRERKGLRSLAPFESDKKIAELPPQTYFFAHYVSLTLHTYDDPNEIVDTATVNRYKPTPWNYFECHIPENGVPEIIGFVSDVQAVDISQLNGVDHKSPHLFPYPWSEAKTLVIIPFRRIILSSYRQIELSESESLVVLDLTIR